MRYVRADSRSQNRLFFSTPRSGRCSPIRGGILYRYQPLVSPSPSSSSSSLLSSFLLFFSSPSRCIRLFSLILYYLFFSQFSPSISPVRPSKPPIPHPPHCAPLVPFFALPTPSRSRFEGVGFIRNRPVSIFFHPLVSVLCLLALVCCDSPPLIEISAWSGNNNTRRRGPAKRRPISLPLSQPRFNSHSSQQHHSPVELRYSSERS